MIVLLLNSSEKDCQITLFVNEKLQNITWNADRKLAKDLLSNINNLLLENKLTLNDLTGLVVYKGPGSYTGLRIGITVMNTLSSSLEIPIIGSEGENWQKNALKRLGNNENEQLVLPEYGGVPHITRPKK